MRRQLKLKPTTAKLQQRGSLPHLQLPSPLGFLPPKMQQPNKPLDSRSCHTHPQPACLLPRTGSKNTNTKVAWLLLLLLLSSLLLLLSSLPLLHLHLRRSQQQGNSSNCKSICKLRLSLVLSSLFSASRSLHSRLRCPLHAACCRLPAG